MAEKERGSRGKDGGWLRAEMGILGAEEVVELYILQCNMMSLGEAFSTV